MSDAPSNSPDQPVEPAPPPPQMPPATYPPPPAGYPPAAYGPGPIGQIRSTGTSILLFIVTFGIYGYFWIYSVHEEMKLHRNAGLGGGLALLLWFFVSPAMAFLTPDEIGKMYEARGQAKPVSALTGLWYVPGFLLLFIGPIVWFVKVNGALNDYWRSLGATD